jgi:hypothetical protein
MLYIVSCAVLCVVQKSAHLLGPKQFAVDRLMAIFYSIIEDKVAPSAHLFTQVRGSPYLSVHCPTSNYCLSDVLKFFCYCEVLFEMFLVLIGRLMCARSAR